jgi:hypothetical protein
MNTTPANAEKCRTNEKKQEKEEAKNCPIRRQMPTITA